MEFGWCGPLPCIFCLDFVGHFGSQQPQPRNSVAGKMPGLGDMNFGDMGGDEYDSDDEDELEWDSWGIHGEFVGILGEFMGKILW